MFLKKPAILTPMTSMSYLTTEEEYILKRIKTEESSPDDYSQVTQEPNQGQLYSMTKEQIKSMGDAMQNPLILHKIIHLLDFPELKTSRLVTTTWFKISTKFIKKGDLCQLQILYDDKRKVYRRTTIENLKKDSQAFYPEYKYGSGHLDELNAILLNSIDFPCTNFLFQFGNMESIDCQNFINLHGSSIQTLHLFGNDTTSKETFHRILTQQAPNVTLLSLSRFTYQWREEEYFTLPNLKIFEWCYSTGTNLKVLQGANNLETVQNFLFCDNPLLVIQTGKISRLQQLNCQVKDKPETWIKLLEAGIKLKTLTFRVQSGNKLLNEIFQNFVNVSKDVLEFLELSQVVQHYGLNLPPLKNLKILEMGFNSGARCFPRGLDLQNTFPNLKSLDCTGLLCHVDDTWEKYFPKPDPFRGTLPYVRTLSVGDDWTQGWLEKFGGICKNLSKLVINCEDDGVGEMLPKVYKIWPNLMKLWIKFNNLPGNGFKIDSPLTGLETETCDQIRNLGWAHALDGNTLQKLRLKPWIGQLKNLCRLHVTILCPIKNEDAFPLSFVSGTCALKFVPRLKTQIEFDHYLINSDYLRLLYQELDSFSNIGHIKCTANS